MNRKEFLEILRSQLAGQMQEGKAAAHIRYYEDYIQSQVRGGRSEQEVLQELGDPHLIAKTLIDTDDGSTQEDYGEYSSYGSSYGNETELPHLYRSEFLLSDAGLPVPAVLPALNVRHVPETVYNLHNT